MPPEYKQESQDYFSDSDVDASCDQTWAKLNDAWGRYRQNAFKNIFNNLKKLGFAKGMMLDIGSAFGHMLNMAINEGFSVLGVEPSHLARQIAYEKFKIQSVKDIDDIKHESRFDVILCLETLYYCYDARQMLDSIRQKLSSSGCLVLKTRCNRTNLFRLCAALNILLKRKLLCVQPGTLLYGYSLRGYHLFTTRNIKKLLADTGFKVIKTVNEKQQLPQKLSLVRILQIARISFASLVSVITLGRVKIGTQITLYAVLDRKKLST